MSAGPKVRIRSDIETENALVITCFPTVGMVSPIVAAYLIEHLELDYIGGIFDSRLPAVAIVNDGMALHPCVSTAAARCVPSTDAIRSSCSRVS